MGKKICPKCLGVGGWTESIVVDGKRLYYDVDCPMCTGTGFVDDVEVERESDTRKP